MQNNNTTTATFLSTKLLQSDLSFIDVNISGVRFAFCRVLERAYVLSSQFKYFNLPLQFNFIIAYKNNLFRDDIISETEQIGKNTLGVQMICCIQAKVYRGLVVKMFEVYNLSGFKHDP
jgi:hypothetical protein